MEKLKTNELSLGLNQTLRNDLVDNFEKIQKGVDSQSDSLNKQILDMLGNVSPQDQNEVTQARIDANGKKYDTLKGRTDATQATAETALSEERDTSVEVQDARTNSSSKTYPTLKERMDNQENDLNNSINNKLSQISVIPETFANLSALQSTYPNGKTGLFVTADTGHKYIWANGTWTDSGIYQAVGIANRSIKKDMLEFNTSISILFPSSDKPLNFDSTLNTLTIPTPTNIIVRGSEQYTIPAQTFSLTNDTGKNHYIVYDTTTNNLDLGDRSPIDDSKVVIGGVRDKMYYLNGPYTVDGFYPYGNDRQAFYSIYSNSTGITVNTVDKTIDLKGLYFNYGTKSMWMPDKNFAYVTNSVLYVYYNIKNNEIQAEQPPINTTSDRILLGWIRPGDSTYSLNISEKQIKFTPFVPGNEYLNTLPNIIGLGDSITAGYVPNASLNGGWPTILSQNVGITVYNEGVSSATIQNGSANDSISFVNRSATIDFSRANDVVIFGGTNDFAQNLPIGNISDNTSNSLYGAMNIIFSKIYASNPNAKVYIVLPMWRARITGGNVDVETTPNSIGLLLKDYCEALKNVANKYNVPYLDAYHNMGINSINSTNWLSDGLHPNDIGYAHLANLIGNFVKINQ